MNLALNGYNVFEGNKMAEGADPGFGLQIFRINENSCYNNFIQVEQTTYCNRYETTQKITNIIDYESKSSGSASNLQEISASLDVSYLFVTAKASYKQTKSNSNSFKKESNFFSKAKGESFINSASCEILKVTIDDFVKPAFETSFINALADIQEEALDKTLQFSERKNIRKFFQDFGTHFQKEVYMGASFLAETRYVSQSLTSAQKSESEQCSQKAYDAALKVSVAGKGGAEAEFKTESKTCSSQYGKESYFNENEFR